MLLINNNDNSLVVMFTIFFLLLLFAFTFIFCHSYDLKTAAWVDDENHTKCIKNSLPDVILVRKVITLYYMLLFCI